jgi:pyruvate/2-oxoglutarate dehydrogenase complex dihydrolipoamide acyltransferase (E2) component
MAIEITMPKFGETMEEGTIVEWKKQVGESVKEGEILVLVDTDKSQLEVESTTSGTLLKILVETDGTVPIHTPIAVIGEPGELV